MIRSKRTAAGTVAVGVFGVEGNGRNGFYLFDRGHQVSGADQVRCGFRCHGPKVRKARRERLASLGWWTRRRKSDRLKTGAAVLRGHPWCSRPHRRGASIAKKSIHRGRIWWPFIRCPHGHAQRCHGNKQAGPCHEPIRYAKGRHAERGQPFRRVNGCGFHANTVAGSINCAPTMRLTST